jgi:biotin carboxyl carrier protein
MTGGSGGAPRRALLVRSAPATALPDDGERVVEPPDPAGSEGDPARDHVATIGAPGRLDADGRVPIEVVVDGWRFEFLVEDADRAALRERASRDPAAAGGGGGPLEIRAIIPGRIVAVAIQAGASVAIGQPLMTVEAMKMQNELRAPRAGSVARVGVGVGATVEIGDLLVVIE